MFLKDTFIMNRMPRTAKVIKASVNPPKKEGGFTTPGVTPVVTRRKSWYSNLLSNKLPIILVLVILVLAAAGYRYKSLVVAATVNGAPIYRLSLIKQLEPQGGKTILDGIIEKTLIEQEAAKANISVT